MVVDHAILHGDQKVLVGIFDPPYKCGAILSASEFGTTKETSMKKSSILVIAALLLLMTSGVGLAEQAGASAADDADAAAAAKAAEDGVGGADCNPVFKAKAEEKSKSPKEIAAKLGLPLEKVNTCFIILRQAGRPQTNH
jgi:hypothetical protein